VDNLIPFKGIGTGVFSALERPARWCLELLHADLAARKRE
jgi:hypothetical protein